MSWSWLEVATAIEAEVIENAIVIAIAVAIATERTRIEIAGFVTQHWKIASFDFEC